MKDLKTFLENSYKALMSSKVGCYFLKLDETFYVVLGYDEESENVLAKVAYNCDDLQCDYDFDWYMPTSVDDGEICFTELVISGEDFEEDADWLLKQYKTTSKLFQSGKVVCK